MTALVARGLTKRYGEAAVVDRLDLSVARGELYGFLGPNGAGKTTTIRMALGLIRPSGGRVEILGGPAAGGESAPPLERVGALVEEPAFWKFLSGGRNLEYFARAGGRGPETRARLGRVEETLRLVGLEAAAGKRVKAYSQGMRQRLGIGLALLGAPELLVLDEPTNGLDPQGMREIRRLLRRLADEGITVFVSSHLLAEVEAICDRVGVMARGRLVAEGPPGSLRGTAERVRVEVEDLARTRSVVGALEGVAVQSERRNASPDTGAGTMQLHLAPPATPATVNGALVEAGVRVSALVPERDTLEDVFLALIEDSAQSDGDLRRDSRPATDTRSPASGSSEGIDVSS